VSKQAFTILAAQSRHIMIEVSEENCDVSLRDILCRMRGKVMWRLVWSVKKLWIAMEPVICYSS